MPERKSIEALVSTVRIYWDPEAFALDGFGKQQGFELKPCHDRLYQKAMDEKLADELVFMDWKRRWTNLAQGVSIAAEKPKWWPVGSSPKNRRDLLRIPVRMFAKSWFAVREEAESEPRSPAFWHDDPALTFPAGENAVLCRTASVGHEGHVFYFVYAREHSWESEIGRFSLPLFGQGAEHYRRLLPVPGEIAGR